MMDVLDVLTNEIGLTATQAHLYLAITTQGRMDCPAMAESLSISADEACAAAESLVNLGALIEYNDTEYEAMHPRFTMVNMYRRASGARGVPTGRNQNVDNAGAALEEPYYAARER